MMLKNSAIVLAVVHIVIFPMVTNCYLPIFSGSRKNHCNGTVCHEYLLSNVHANWEEAHTTCTWFKGELAYIPNDEINNLLAGLSTENILVWIDGTDKKQEGSWLARDGNELTYSHWNEGQPDNRPSHLGETADCLMLSLHSGQWIDNICAWKYRFICEFKSDLSNKSIQRSVDASEEPPFADAISSKSSNSTKGTTQMTPTVPISASSNSSTLAGQNFKTTSSNTTGSTHAGTRTISISCPPDSPCNGNHTSISTSQATASTNTTDMKMSSTIRSIKDNGNITYYFHPYLLPGSESNADGSSNKSKSSNISRDNFFNSSTLVSEAKTSLRDSTTKGLTIIHTKPPTSITANISTNLTYMTNSSLYFPISYNDTSKVGSTVGVVTVSTSKKIHDIISQNRTKSTTSTTSRGETLIGSTHTSTTTNPNNFVSLDITTSSIMVPNYSGGNTTITSDDFQTTTNAFETSSTNNTRIHNFTSGSTDVPSPETLTTDAFQTASTLSNKDTVNLSGKATSSPTILSDTTTIIDSSFINHNTSTKNWTPGTITKKTTSASSAKTEKSSWKTLSTTFPTTRSSSLPVILTSDVNSLAHTSKSVIKIDPSPYGQENLSLISLSDTETINDNSEISTANSTNPQIYISASSKGKTETLGTAVTQISKESSVPSTSSPIPPATSKSRPLKLSKFPSESDISEPFETDISSDITLTSASNDTKTNSIPVYYTNTSLVKESSSTTGKSGAESSIMSTTESYPATFTSSSKNLSQTLSSPSEPSSKQPEGSIATTSTSNFNLSSSSSSYFISSSPMDIIHHDTSNTMVNEETTSISNNNPNVVSTSTSPKSGTEITAHSDSSSMYSTTSNSLRSKTSRVTLQTTKSIQAQNTTSRASSSTSPTSTTISSTTSSPSTTTISSIIGSSTESPSSSYSNTSLKIPTSNSQSISIEENWIDPNSQDGKGCGFHAYFKQLLKGLLPPLSIMFCGNVDINVLMNMTNIIF